MIYDRSTERTAQVARGLPYAPEEGKTGLAMDMCFANYDPRQPGLLYRSLGVGAGRRVRIWERVQEFRPQLLGTSDFMRHCGWC